MTAELADMKRISLGRRVDHDPLDSIIQHMLMWQRGKMVPRFVNRDEQVHLGVLLSKAEQVLNIVNKQNNLSLS
jgi:hypothetical protein